jgi:hypothetical protein
LRFLVPKTPTLVYGILWVSSHSFSQLKTNILKVAKMRVNGNGAVQTNFALTSLHNTNQNSAHETSEEVDDRRRRVVLIIVIETKYDNFQMWKGVCPGGDSKFSQFP